MLFLSILGLELGTFHNLIPSLYNLSQAPRASFIAIFFSFGLWFRVRLGGNHTLKYNENITEDRTVLFILRNR